MREASCFASRGAVACGLLLLLACLAGAAPKKLIEFGWDRPSPSYVAAHLTEMEKIPFDGICMELPGANNIFVDKSYNSPGLQAELKTLATINWHTFTDNFIVVNCATEIDWTNDSQWTHALYNLVLNAHAAALGHCKGLFFDPEAYGDSPWYYPALPHAAEWSFADYATLMEQRGAECMTAIQQELPSPVINLLLFTNELKPVILQRDPALRDRMLANNRYGLLPAFLNGMLRVAQPGTVIFDGNEFSYYYTKAQEYYDAATFIHTNAMVLIARDNYARYRSIMDCGHALYLDNLFNLGKSPSLAASMTPDERMKWFGYDLYYALRTADGYVWLYSNHANWWDNTNIPPGILDTMTAIKQKVATGRALGYDITKIIASAMRRQKSAAAP